jgi:putative glutamine amidotransferase
MPRPIIALTSWRHPRAARDGEPQWTDICCGDAYVRAVAAAGGAPLVLPRLAELDAVRDALAPAQGLLLTGGGDVQAAVYGAQPHPRSGRQDPARDAMELEAIAWARKAGVPILGICRGIQILNAALGGTLIQDIPSEVPGAMQHWIGGDADYLGHEVAVEPGSLAARALGTTSLATNSWHHQAVREVASGLRVTARTADGIIEALESSAGEPILAVQFHPEMSFDAAPAFLGLFRWLVEAAAAR